MGQIEMAGAPKSDIPGVWMEITEDAKSGYNIHFITSNFTFTPEKVNTEHRLGEGTLTLFVNGDKIGRVYNEWYHLEIQEKGTYEIVVTINANTQSEYTIRGTPISSRQTLTID